MDVCLILFRRKVKPVRPDTSNAFMETSWDDSLKLMAEAGFLQKFLRYPTDSITAEMVDLMSPYINNE